MKVIGLMSGTSSDGVDAALVDIRGGSKRLHIKPLAFRLFPYPRTLQKKLIDVASGLPHSADIFCHLNVYIGELFSEAVIRLASEAGAPLSDIALIGSHGQTVQHLPTPRRCGKWSLRSTLQLGEASIIAERTGITTIADFRPRDIAAGGEGAPLTPYLHHHLFKHPRKTRAILNLGGISNVTYLQAGASLNQTIAFDIGPGNMLIDGLVTVLTRSRKRFDQNGRMARQGKTHPKLYAELMRHPFLKKPPPKSTGRETFGLRLADRVLKKSKSLRLGPEDIIATASAFTVGAVSKNILQYHHNEGPIHEIIVGGGGARNPFLIQSLADTLAPIPVLDYETFGLDSRAIEAMAFAVLAYQTWHGRPSNIPTVTGASHPVVLGKIIPAPPRTPQSASFSY
ncbi:MAG: anhydro-N-acetylmuramic acid kinase [Nitrospiria bacterium]